MAVNDRLFKMDVVIFRWIMSSKMEPKPLSPDAFARLKICKKCICGRGSAPDPVWGAHSVPQTLSWMKGKGKGMEGKGKGP